jgi:hypothetical protein
MAAKKKADHDWQDLALIRSDQGGTGWIAGISFRCRNCGLDRRAVQGEGFHVQKGHADGKVSWIYFMDGKRIGAQECAREARTT